MDSAAAHNDGLLPPLQLRIAAGDPAAFRELFHLYFHKLSAFACSFVKTEEVAAEITDEIFLRIWNNRATLPEIGSLRVYLYRAVKNESLNYLSRKAKQHLYEPFDDIHIRLTDEQNPEKLMISRELSQRIREAVESLPPRCKIIFKLVKEDGLRYQEVADILNLSVKTVDAQMVIAVSRLREAVKENFHQLSPKTFKKIHD